MTLEILKAKLETVEEIGDSQVKTLAGILLDYIELNEEKKELGFKK